MTSPQTVCIVSNKSPSYSETFIRAHVEHLPAEIVFACGRPFPDHCDGRPLLAKSLLARLSREVLKSWHQLPPDTDYFRARAFRRVLTERRVDIVLAEYGKTGLAIASDCATVGVPLVVHFHGHDAHSESGGHATTRRRYPELFATASAIVAVSQTMRQELLALGCPPDKLHLCPYGVDCERFTPAIAGENPPLFVGVGRFVDKKAPYLTLLAFARICSAVPEARLLLVGDGELLEACRQLARVLGIADRVELSGKRSHEEVATLLGQARAFVQHSVTTSYGDSEGTPVAVLEAGARGLPVIATRHAGIREAIVEGETGLLGDEYDIEAMARHMLDLATCPDLATRLGGAARSRIERHYSLTGSIERLWQILCAASIQPPSSS